MHRYVQFYKHSEYLFEGTFVDEQFINSNIDPEGYIKVKGNCPLNVEGSFSGEPISEEVSRLSDNVFTSIIRITSVDCIDNIFTGSIKAVTSGGAPIPIDRRLFGISTILQRDIPSRKQDEVGISSFDNTIYLSIRDVRARDIAITDYATIEGEPTTFQVRDAYEAGPNLFMIQLTYKR